MSTQPNALRLADDLDAYHTRSCHKESAAELRAQHDLIQKLTAALKLTAAFCAGEASLSKRLLVNALEKSRDALAAAEAHK